MKEKSILLIGERKFIDYLQKSLYSHQLYAMSTPCLDHAAELLKEKFYPIVVCSIPHGNYSPESLLDYLKEYSPDSNIIYISEDIQLTKVINLVKNGLYYFIKKPFLIEDLITHIEKGLSNEETKDKVTQSPKKSNLDSKLPNYVKGQSQPAKTMYSQIQLVAPTNFNVIIYGETGTGKESVAQRLITARGDNSPFVAIDCGCLSKELAASVLFGHEKGAFTGAQTVKKGAFEQANGGTLFLDEIGNLDYEIQTYLLRAIQERKIRKVGGEKEIPVNVRIIVASNENLGEKVKKGEFREDLFHRLNEFEITIPPLRERAEDLELFINHFIHEGNTELGKNIKGIDKETLKLLQMYNWPGNIRELKNIIRRASLLTPDGSLITKKIIPQEITEYTELPKEIPTESDFVPASSTQYLKKFIEKTEIETILDVLQKVNYNKTKAAALLNMDRKTIYNKLKKIQQI